nr:DNA (cytosine-5-)-methyltransferase [uncultured Pseudomonas sp.]
MTNPDPIQVVDLFAGPGGLGEGFSSFNDGRSFKIVVSAEMDPTARATLKLRAFYRELRINNPDGLSDYYAFCNGTSQLPYSDNTLSEWLAADQEARCITLGTPVGDQELDSYLDAKLDVSKPWVLIGGPPCQAYSIVGRARNKGKADYSAENDHRHFLYREYLRIIHERKPAIFVMENVKGILSSKVGGQKIFPKILQDLADPDAALGFESSGRKYRIFSFVSDKSYGPEFELGDIDFGSFVIKPEKFGIPQTRHRVILLGVAINDCKTDLNILNLRRSDPVSVGDVIGDLPKIRSRLSKGGDGDERWTQEILSHFEYLSSQISLVSDHKLALALNIAKKNFFPKLKTGAVRLKKHDANKFLRRSLRDWFVDDRLDYLLQHDARGHMPMDLRRYLYAAVFANAYGFSPKGHHDFALPGLAPNHKNWETGKFSDRFRVQIKDSPASTVTSHISKDGHYFIHYDATQCRSLTVREAARLQTFPDNYYFMGNRTEQFHQVGNAVPPFLAVQMAEVVSAVLNQLI